MYKTETDKKGKKKKKPEGNGHPPPSSPLTFPTSLHQFPHSHRKQIQSLQHQILLSPILKAFDTPDRQSGVG